VAQMPKYRPFVASVHPHLWKEWWLEGSARRQSVALAALYLGYSDRQITTLLSLGPNSSDWSATIETAQALGLILGEDRIEKGNYQ